MFLVKWVVNKVVGAPTEIINDVNQGLGLVKSFTKDILKSTSFK